MSQRDQVTQRAIDAPQQIPARRRHHDMVGAASLRHPLQCDSTVAFHTEYRATHRGHAVVGQRKGSLFPDAAADMRPSRVTVVADDTPRTVVTQRRIENGRKRLVGRDFAVQSRGGAIGRG
ncbi:hypothetical protein D3C72_1449320 [compost metagenome]